MSLLDVAGPVMIGPSSSHTLGALRIGLFVNYLFGGAPEKVDFYLHQSFAETFEGHGTDRALIAGILGYDQDDPEVKNSLIDARRKKIKFNFLSADLGDVHPNTVKIEAWSGRNFQEVWGSSIGAGMIRIIQINGIECALTGSYPSLVIVNKDTPNALGKILQKIEVNVANLYLKRINKLLSKAMSIIELDEEMRYSNLFDIKSLDVVEEAYYINKLVRKK